MKKNYTRKQITEAIAYWKKQLNEAYAADENDLVRLNVRDRLADAAYSIEEAIANISDIYMANTEQCRSELRFIINNQKTLDSIVNSAKSIAGIK